MANCPGRPARLCSHGSHPGACTPGLPSPAPTPMGHLSPGVVEGPVMRTQAPGRGELRKHPRGPSQRLGLPATSPTATVLTVLPPWLGARAQCPVTLRPGPGLAPASARSAVATGLRAPRPSPSWSPLGSGHPAPHCQRDKRTEMRPLALLASTCGHCHTRWLPGRRLSSGREGPCSPRDTPVGPSHPKAPSIATPGWATPPGDTPGSLNMPSQCQGAAGDQKWTADASM